MIVQKELNLNLKPKKKRKSDKNKKKIKKWKINVEKEIETMRGERCRSIAKHKGIKIQKPEKPGRVQESIKSQMSLIFQV